MGLDKIGDAASRKSEGRNPKAEGQVRNVGARTLRPRGLLVRSFDGSNQRAFL